MKTRVRSALTFIPLILIMSAFSLRSAEEIPATPDGRLNAKPGQDETDDLNLEGQAGAENKSGTLVRVAAVSDPKLDMGRMCFWRTLPGVVAAQTTPPRFWIDGTAVIEPRLRVGSDKEYTYPVGGRMKLDPGEHVLTPGSIRFTIGSNRFDSPHPALAAGQGDELLIRCAAVRFEAADESGAPLAVPIKLRLGADSLLREDANFSALTVWLPVGMKYESSFGPFGLSAAGKIEATALPDGVSATAAGLKLVRPRVASVKAAPAPTVSEDGLTLVQSGRLACAMPAVVKPGAAPFAAFSRAAYEQEAKEPFSVSHFACVSAAGSSPPSEAKAPDARAASAAAKLLKTTMDDLLWLKLPLPAGYFGAFSFTLTSKAPAIRHTLLVADTSASLWLVPHCARTAFEQGEVAVYQVVLPSGFKGGEAKVLCRSEAQPFDLGTVTLPGAEAQEFGARLFTLETHALPPGDYVLWVEAGDAKSGGVPLTIVPAFLSRSPFFVHTMSGCTGAWPTTDEGLDLLRKCGLEMATATGHASMLDLGMPGTNTDVAGAGNLPAEMALQSSKNDLLLDRLLRHRLRMIDMAVVRPGSFYNESLSYHHSYQPSVDRMVRRMQIFTQQSGAYPSWAGINYSWFPAWWGYVEGGVPTDPHTKDRNEALAAAVKDAGVSDASKEEREWYEKNKLSSDPAAREKALAIMRKAISFWKAREDLAWGKHNALYNNAVRSIRPQTVFTLFDNAGHDMGKRTRALFGDMAAACYESYTDFGEWPMSAAFTTDWARGNDPRKRVWLTTDWGTSSEGQVKSLFHAFGRGLSGGGTPLQAEAGLKEIARRGSAMAFLGQYGAIAARATPDNRFAILMTAAHQVLRGGQRPYDYHALYYHLTRLGCAPALLADEDVLQTGIPAATKVLLLVREEDPFEPKLVETLQAFQKAGGQILTTSDCLVQIQGATIVPVKTKHIWELSGFAGKIHGEMWEQFEKSAREPLAAALANTGVPPLAVADWERGVAVALTADSMRYVVVIAEKKGAASGTFEPVEGMPVSLEGTGWTVRDLVKQTTLRAEQKDGRTVAFVDLITEPATILALYKSAPGNVHITLERDGLHLGGTIAASGHVIDKAGARMGPVPVRLTLADPNGVERETVYRAAGEEAAFPLADRDLAGAWKLTVQELITGFSVTTEINVPARERETSVTAAIGDVHIVNTEHLRAYAKSPIEKWIILESGQEKLLPVASQLKEALVAAGMKARVWQVTPEEYDTLPTRWYPRSYDKARMRLIEEGKLIGYRGNMTAYIDAKTRSHVPEKGGWMDIDPPYMVGSDCVVFSGGRLAQSLRAVTTWMETPNVPAKGQGRLVAVFSPFLAGKMAVAIVGNDETGMAKAAKALGAVLCKKEDAQVSDRSGGSRILRNELQAVPQPVVHPYHNFTPLRRVERLLATADGKAVVFLKGGKDTLAFVDETGKITSTVAAEATEKDASAVRKYDVLDAAGNLWHYVRKATSFNEAWHFATSHVVTVQCISPAGLVVREGQMYDGDTSEIAPEWWFEGSFPVAPDGATALLGRKGGFLLGKLSDGAWAWHDDLPFVRENFELRTPRFPVGVTFSPDSKCVFLTMDTRPQPFGGMNGRAIRPMGNESILIECASGKRLWSLRAKEAASSTYAVHPGFAAVSMDGNITAFTDWNGVIYAVDKAGKFLAQAPSVPAADSRGRNGPTNGVGTWISNDGAVAAFGFTNLLMIASGGKVTSVPLAAMVSGCVSVDGSLTIAALDSGEIRAFAADGSPKWTFAAGNAGAFVAAVAADKTLAATSAGELVLLDKDGRELRRSNFAASADKERHGLSVAPDVKRFTPPQNYREPDTLAVAQKLLGAKQIAAWKPEGAAKAAFGRNFFTLEAPVSLSAAAERECFLCVVYRRPAENKTVTITTNGADGSESFVLDLPTPEYRVVCVPVRGPKASVTLTPGGPVEIAEFSLWSMRWPGTNVAFVKQPGSSAADRDILDDTEKKGDGLELEEGKASAGSMKDVKIWWPNPDVDKVAGQWLKPKVSGLAMVDGKRFGNGKLAPWAGDCGALGSNFAGAWMTIDFGKPATISLVATYERASKQSEVSRQIAVLNGFDGENSKVLSGAIGNDQFWRLLPLPQPASLRVLGILSHNGGQTGLSEVEAYK
ncbi:MAG TPA: hypothetical protein VGP72_32835 [Planctomycetota bacterium]|jgi:hypothetical protein